MRRWCKCGAGKFFSLILLIAMLIVAGAVVVSATITITFTEPTTSDHIYTGSSDVLNATVTINDYRENVTNITWSYSTDGSTFNVINQLNYSATLNFTTLNISFDTTTVADSSDIDFRLFVEGWNRTNLTSTITGLKLDNIVPNSTLVVKDKNGNDVTSTSQIGYAQKTTIDCSAADIATGLNTSRNFISIIYPGLSNPENLTLASNSNTELIGIISEGAISTIGVYSIRCTVFDNAGFVNTSELNVTSVSVIVDSGSPFIDPNFEAPIASKLIGRNTVEDYAGKYGAIPESGVARLIKKGGAIKLNVGGEDHVVTVENIIDDSAVLLIASEPFTVDINSGETKEIDTNADGVNDLEIYLHKIHQKAADLVFKEISVPIIQQPPETSEPTDVSDTVAPPKSTKSYGWLWTLLALILLALILMAVLHKTSRGHKGGQSQESGVKFTPRDLGASREASWGADSKNKNQGPFY